ncbi:MogA/MoaB family molybdenum cofactor biosynthesis protein [Corynebacterium xerosis]|jgi:molybdenum cofactor synthesis domain-containing protein|uniref:Molybdenum cofactor biosynthesis protein n=1 Tax=Corynebacterium xerosis TaxID=1725 RepID=A0A7X9XTR6_9CORY|nr:molybdopterin-binding protein [Corynebacterium xerosis]NMF09904.1 molybdenum cofactor biosynthesis protein [Corynebacterium xerosis]HJG57032.1 molybdenum cofactor biosynthesis protein [Corynebacterium xerosis]
MGELENGVQGVQYGDDVLAPDLEPDEGNLEAIEREIAVAAQTRRALVVLVGDRAAEDERTGELMVELLEEDGYRVDAVVASPSEKRQVRKALETAVVGGADLVVTVGGVGVSPRDLVPEATRKVLDRRLSGIEQALRASGLAAGSTEAGLSRGLAGVSGSTVVVNLADSRAAVRDGMATLGPLVSHVIEDLGRWRV